MKRIAMIPSGTNQVENVASWDGISTWEPEGYTLLDVTDQLTISPGDTYNATTHVFIKPDAPEVPLANQLDDIFRSMSDEVRSQFYVLKATIQQALLDGDIISAKTLIANTP